MYLHTQDLNDLLPQTPPWSHKLAVGYTQVWGLVQAVVMCPTQDARLKEQQSWTLPFMAEARRPNQSLQAQNAPAHM